MSFRDRDRGNNQESRDSRDRNRERYGHRNKDRERDRSGSRGRSVSKGRNDKRYRDNSRDRRDGRREWGRDRSRDHRDYRDDRRSRSRSKEKEPDRRDDFGRNEPARPSQSDSKNALPAPKVNMEQVKRERMALVKSLTSTAEPVKKKNDTVGDKGNGDGEEMEEDGEEDIAELLGFSGFGSTKGKCVAANHTGAAVGAVSKFKERKYRQYMNRKGGFNRPLDKMD